MVPALEGKGVPQEDTSVAAGSEVRRGARCGVQWFRRSMCDHGIQGLNLFLLLGSGKVTAAGNEGAQAGVTGSRAKE